MEDFETIVAVYDTPAHAELAANDLREANVPETAISRHEGSSTGTAAPHREQGFWASLFGGESDDEHVYEHSARSGSTIVSVQTPLRDVSAVMEILERHSPVDLEERTATLRSSGTMPAPAMGADYISAPSPTAQPASAYADRTFATQTTGDTVQLSEEQLTVGKRLVNRGGTRLRRYVVETPVAEDVSLHSETVKVERRLVTGGVVSEPDFSEKTIEMTSTAEEAVVGKTARVVEEVSLHRQATDRVETVHDTVRKEEVEVEQIPGETVVETTTKSGEPLDPRAPRI